ncbi:MAG: DNA methyltransferase [Flavobacteriaceae bacterium]
MSAIVKKMDYRDISTDADIAVYDPPFDIWKDVEIVTNAKTTICFTNHKNRKFVEQKLGYPKIELIWHFKDGRWVSHKHPRHTHEYIMVYGDIANECYVGDLVENRTPVNKGFGCVGRDKLAKRVYTPRERKMLNSVIEIPRNVGKTMGVWGKPKKLVDQILDWLGYENAVLWDGFAGSGVFGRSAIERGMHYIGCDIETGEFSISDQKQNKQKEDK